MFLFQARNCLTEFKSLKLAQKTKIKRIFPWIFLVVKSNEKLAVFAHIVGGGFFTNPTDDAVAGPDFLLDQGVIFVTFGSRLGPFGYM